MYKIAVIGDYGSIYGFATLGPVSYTHLGRTFYTSNAGLQELRDEICKYLERKIHVSYDPKKETMVTVGGSEAIDVALRCMLDPGDEVLIPQPSYVSYLPCTIMADGVPVIVELKLSLVHI